VARRRAKAGAAMDSIVAGLEARGWQGLHAEGREEPLTVASLTGPRQSVWIQATDRDEDGGVVTVVLGRP
jgi:hypothetical protein